eukprot:Pgem_evm1s10334
MAMALILALALLALVNRKGSAPDISKIKNVTPITNLVTMLLTAQAKPILGLSLVNLKLDSGVKEDK